MTPSPTICSRQARSLRNIATLGWVIAILQTNRATARDHPTGPHERAQTAGRKPSDPAWRSVWCQAEVVPARDEITEDLVRTKRSAIVLGAAAAAGVLGVAMILVAASAARLLQS